MPNHLSILGIIHTAISIIAIILALVALFRDGSITPRNSIGKWYVIFTIVTCFTSFGIMKTGHFTPAHVLSIIVLVLLAIALYARKLFGRRGESVEIILMSATVFLSFIPAITETLTRLPVSHPIADSPDASVIKIGNLVLLIVFAVGTFLQINRLRRSKVAV